MGFSKIVVENARFPSISRVKQVLKRNRIKNFLKNEIRQRGTASLHLKRKEKEKEEMGRC